MATIKFSNGATVTFNGTPTQADIENVAQQIMGQPKPTSLLGSVWNGAKAFGKALISNEQNFGSDVAAAIGGNQAIDEASKTDALASQTNLNFIKAMKAKIAAGQSLTPQQQQLYNQIVGSIGTGSGSAVDTATAQFPALGKSNLQVLGDAAGTTLDALSGGTLGGVFKGTKAVTAAKDVAEAAKPTLAGSVVKAIEGTAPSTGTKLAAIGKQYLTSAAKLGGLGYAYDVSGNLQVGKTGAAAATPGLGTAAGIALPIVPAVAKSIAAIGKAQAPRVVNSLVKPLLKDFSYGKNPGRAVAQAGITGNSLDDLAKNIATHRQSVGEQIGQLSTQLDTKLQKTAQTIGQITPGRGVQLNSALKPIDEAMQTAAKTNNSTLLARLQNVKDALTHVLTLGEENGSPAIVKGVPRNLANSTFKGAFNLKRQIGDMTRWTGNESDDKAVNGALKQVYGKVKDAIDSAAERVDGTTAGKLRALNEQYADLTSAEIATTYRDKINARQGFISAPVKAGTIAGLIAAPFTGGLSLSTLLVGLGAFGADKALQSAAVKTRVAAWLAQESPSVLERFYAAHPAVAQAIARAFDGDVQLSQKGSASIGALGAGALGSTGLAAGFAASSAPRTVTAANDNTPTGGIAIASRGVSIAPRELTLLRNVLFAEISNRSSDKQELEAKTIINTALNRMKAEGKTLTAVLTAPKQYQGYGSQEYGRILGGKTDAGDTQKLAAIDAVLAELKTGNFADNTDGRIYYHHNPDGSITATAQYPYGK